MPEHNSNVSDGPKERHIEALWEIADVARYLGVSIPTVRNHIKDRGLPVRWVGGVQRFRQSEIDAWVDSHPAEKQQPQEPAA